MRPLPPRSSLFPYTTLFRSADAEYVFEIDLTSGSGARFEDIDVSKRAPDPRSEEHTSELQSRPHLVCRLLLEKKKHLRYPPPTTFPAPCPTLIGSDASPRIT